MAEAAAPVVREGLTAVRNFDGSVSYVAPGDLEKAAGETDARFATDAEAYNADLGRGAAPLAAAVGAGRGASLGLIDPALIEGTRLLGGDENAEIMREALLQAKEMNPNASLVGEIAGSLAGMYAIPGGAAADAVMGEGMVARAASRLAANAPRLIGEGVALGVGQQESENALYDHERHADDYLAAGIKGGLLNLFVGGALHAGTGALGDRLAGKLARGESAAARALTEDTESAASRLARGEQMPEKTGLLDWIKRESEEQALKATGAKLRDWQKFGATAEAQAERAQRIGRTLLDEGIVDATASQATIGQRLTAKVRQVGEELGAMRAKLDTATVRPSKEAISDRVFREIVLPLEQMPGMQAERAAVRDYMSEFLAKADDGLTFEQLHKFRRGLDDKLSPKLWNKVPGSAPQGAVELGKIRGILEDEFEAAGERAAKELGESFGDGYRLKKTLYSDLRTAEKIATKEAARGNANRTWSLTDTIMGGLGLAAAGPAGLVAAGANKLVRTQGNQAAADLLNRAAKLESVQRISAQVDDTIDKGLRALLTGAPRPKLAPKPPAATEQLVRELREGTRNASAITERLAAQMAGIQHASPGIARAAAMSVGRTAAYIQSRLPKEPQGAPIPIGPQAPRTMKRSELARVEPMLEVLTSPDAVIDALIDGRLSREHIEALKVFHPPYYARMQRKVREIGQSGEAKALTEQQGVGLSVLFEVPVTAQMQPSTVLGFQDAFATASQPPPAQQGGAKGLGRPSRVKYATALDRIEGGQ